MKDSVKSIISYLKKHSSFSNFWVRNGFIIILLSVLANNLFEPKNFPFHEGYKFPLVPIIVSIISGFILILIARFNFKYYKNKYFTRKINIETLIRFLFSTLGYITILYLILYFGLNGLVNGTEAYSMYHLLKGLSVTLLICTLTITLLFSIDIYKLHKLISTEGTVYIKQGGKITLVKYSEIAFIFSENKIVYIVKIDGATISTDFTLNEVESKIREQNFYRANRQTILHPRSVEQVQSIENGKLSVVLKPSISGQQPFQIIISRYKKQEFMNWFQNKV